VRHRIRSKLTFANVMSLIAVFLVIGGSAYAGTKLNGKKLKNNSVGPVKLHCPSAASSRTGDICYSGLQPATDWIKAIQNGCPSKNLRLPTNGEALLVTRAAGGETWTDDVITPNTTGEAGRVEGGVVFSTALASSHAYRCVAIAG
jgi:hypothetical protein